MDAWQSLVNVAAIVAGVAVLAGLIVRGRVQRAYFFALFLALTSAYGLVVALRPTYLPELRRLGWWQVLRSWVTDRTFDLRLETLERGFGVVGRAGASLAGRVATEVWAALCGRARHLALDFGTLSRESLASARALLKALQRDRDPPL